MTDLSHIGETLDAILSSLRRIEAVILSRHEADIQTAKAISYTEQKVAEAMRPHLDAEERRLKALVSEIEERYKA